MLYKAFFWSENCRFATGMAKAKKDKQQRGLALSFENSLYIHFPCFSSSQIQLKILPKNLLNIHAGEPN